MALPTITERTAIAAGATQTVTPTAPSASTSGKLLLLVTGVENANPHSFGEPPGWTQLVAAQNSFGSARLTVFSRVGDGSSSDDGVGLLNAAPAAGWQSTIYVIEGADTSAPIDVSVSANQNSGANPTVPGVTTTGPDRLLLSWLFTTGADVTGDPSGWTPDAKNEPSANSLYCYSKTAATAGSYGGETITVASHPGVRITVAITPAVEGGGDPASEGSVAVTADATCMATGELIAPKVETLVELFGGSTLPTTFTDESTGAGALVVAGDGLLVCDASGGAGSAKAESAAFYDLTDSELRWQWLIGGTGGTSAGLALIDPSGDFYSVAFIVSTGLIRVLRFGSISLYEDTYDTVTHQFWRVTESAGSLVFQSSDDGEDWTTRWTEALSSYPAFDATRVRLSWQANASGANSLFLAVDAINAPLDSGVVGAADLNAGATAAATGTLDIEGTAAASAGAACAATGEVSLAGAASASADGLVSATGEIAIEGVATCQAEATTAATAALRIAGTATCTADAVAVATGALRIAGVGACEAGATVAASSSSGTTGTATCVAEASVVATGELPITGAASVTADAVAGASGELPVEGAGAGVAEASVVATGALALEAVATASADATTTATGALAITGTAACQADATVNAYSSSGVQGSATCTAEAIAEATGRLALVAVGGASADATCSASGELVLAAVGTAAANAIATAVGALGLVGVGTASAGAEIVAAATLRISGQAVVVVVATVVATGAEQLPTPFPAVRFFTPLARSHAFELEPRSHDFASTPQSHRLESPS